MKEATAVLSAIMQVVTSPIRLHSLLVRVQKLLHCKNKIGDLANCLITTNCVTTLLILIGAFSRR